MKTTLAITVSTLFAALFSFGYTPVAFGQWSGESLRIADKMNRDLPTSSNTFASTVWGAVSAYDNDEIPNDESTDLAHLIPTSFYRQQEISALIYTQKSGSSPFTRVAPLIIILPGFFNNTTGAGGARNLNLYRSLGYHVAVLPNAWSDQALRQIPSTKPGDLNVEAAAVLEFIQNVRAQIGAENISRVDVLGESYGAMLAAVVAAQDAAANQHQIDGTVTLVSPPLSSNYAFKSLDHIYKDAGTNGKNCEQTELALLWNDFWESLPFAPSAQAVNCAESMVGDSFHRGLVAAASLVTDLFSPSPPADQIQTFSDYGSKFAPELAAVFWKSDQGELTHWLALASPVFGTRLNVISAQDDFLNAPEKWSEIRKILSDPAQLILLNWGGHLGYAGDSDYLDLLKASAHGS